MVDNKISPSGLIYRHLHQYKERFTELDKLYKLEGPGRGLLIMGLPCKHEDLGSGLQNPHKKQVWWCVPVTLALGGLRSLSQADPWSQSSPVDKPQFQ